MHAGGSVPGCTHPEQPVRVLRVGRGAGRSGRVDDVAQLRALQLFGNPLEFLPELSPCTALRYLSLANARPRACRASACCPPYLDLRMLHATPRVACGMLLAVTPPLHASRLSSRACLIFPAGGRLHASRSHARAAYTAAPCMHVASGCRANPCPTLHINLLRENRGASA